jgi:hypothetical protein
MDRLCIQLSRCICPALLEYELPITAREKPWVVPKAVMFSQNGDIEIQLSHGNGSLEG